MKLFPSGKVLTYDDLPVANPLRESTDFSSPLHQAASHASAGYTPAGPAPTQESGLRIWSDDKYCYRSQDGQLWVKPK